MDKVMLEIMSEFRTLPYDLKLDVLNFVKNMKEKKTVERQLKRSTIIKKYIFLLIILQKGSFVK